MMTMMSAWYIKEAKKDFRLLVILGIRRRTVYMQFLLEFWAGVLIAAVFGLGAGAVAASAMRMELQRILAERYFRKSLPETIFSSD